MGKILNEENYQRTKKKLSLIALIILIVGLLVGGGLIIGGISKINYTKNHKQEVLELEDKAHDEFFANGMSAEWRRLNAQIEEINGKKTSGAMMCGFGGFILFATAGASAVVFFIAKRREIAAFSAQQIMPVAQEGMETMTPTIANTVGTIAGEVTKSVKKAKNETDNKN